MKIKKTTYKNISALKLETKKYTILILPDEGAKLASFIYKENDREYLMQNPSPQYLKLGLSGEFEKSECSGFDDMFPTIDPVTIENSNREKLHYPDHGEICRLPFEYEICNESVILTCRSKITKAEYIKTIKEGKDGEIEIFYKIINPTSFDIDLLWAAHCLVRAEKGGQVITPFKDGDAVDIVYDSENNFAENYRCEYKKEYLFSDWVDHVPTAKKLYFSEKCPDGFVGYRYPTGEAFVMRFNKEALPYLGIWQDNGKINGTYSVGIEPCTAGYDTVINAKKHKHKCDLKSGERWEIFLSLSVEENI